MLKKFGQTVLDYFLINYPNTYSFKLSVDDYTFSEFANMAGLLEDEVISKIQAKNTNYSNEFEALAIAAYQVKLVGDLESVQSAGSDSYYQKIKGNYPCYKYSDNNEICNGYFSCQVSLWQTVKELFRKKGRVLNIPQDHYGAGRYVQYPVKSHELKNSELLIWADRFIKAGIKPNDINISYKKFCSKFVPNCRSESIKRTIYNFYKIWDGRSYADILNRRHRNFTPKDKTAVDTPIVLDYLDSKVEFYNQETGEQINDITILEPLFYSSNNKVFFVQNEDDDFYSPKKNKIDYGTDFIIILKNALNIADSYLENKITQVVNKNLIAVYVIRFSKEVCAKFDISVVQKPPINLVGGLKKSNKCYFTFGLPTIEFEEPQKVMFLNSNMVQIDSDKISLGTLDCLENIRKKGGSVVIRLADYLPINFKVESFDTESKVHSDVVGWELNANRFVPVNLNNSEEKVIGFNSSIEFKPVITNTLLKDSRRAFIKRNDFLKNRFDNVTREAYNE